MALYAVVRRVYSEHRYIVLGAAFVTGTFFHTLEAHAAFGRTIDSRDDQHGHDRVAAISLGLWKATDPLTFTVVAVVLFFVASVTCLIPALQATRVDPAQTLRQT